MHPTWRVPGRTRGRLEAEWRRWDRDEGERKGIFLNTKSAYKLVDAFGIQLRSSTRWVWWGMLSQREGAVDFGFDNRKLSLRFPIFMIQAPKEKGCISL